MVTLAKNAGFCFGVSRAYDLAFSALDTDKPIYTLGHFIHNEQVTKRLSGGGAQYAAAWQDIPSGARVILRAHYIEGQTWERTCITASVGWGTVHNWHRKALRELAKNPYTFVQSGMV